MSDEEFKTKALTHFEETRQFQDEMRVAVFGNERAQIPGLAKRVNELEEYKSKDERFKQKVAGGLFVISIAGVPFWEWVKKQIGL